MRPQRRRVGSVRQLRQRDIEGGMTRLLSLASGVLPEFPPEQAAAAAISAGWPAVGIWVDPAKWTSAIAKEIRDRSDDAGVAILDVEVVWIKPGPDNSEHFRIVDAGVAIGARNVLIVSSDPDPAATAAKFARLADHAAQGGLRASLEFASFTEVRSIGAACDILDTVARANAGLLIDPLHLARTGGTPGDLRAVDSARFAYAQFCDAVATGPDPDDIGAIIREAVDLRLDVGQGALPLQAMLDALPPELPLSIELRSKALRQAYPDASERAAALLTNTRRGLASIAKGGDM
jgi:sugar phosphate isomerase/epimerase